RHHDATVGAGQRYDEGIRAAATAANAHQALMPSQDFPDLFLHGGAQGNEQAALGLGPGKYVILALGELVTHYLDAPYPPVGDRALDVRPEGGERLRGQQVPAPVQQGTRVERVERHSYTALFSAAASARRPIWPTLTLR